MLFVSITEVEGGKGQRNGVWLTCGDGIAFDILVIMGRDMSRTWTTINGI